MKAISYVYLIHTMMWPVVALRVVGIFSRIADEDELRVKNECILGKKEVMNVENFLYAFRLHGIWQLPLLERAYDLAQCTTTAWCQWCQL